MVSGLGIATISAPLQIFGIFSWRMQELRKSQNQDLRADLAWSMNPGKMESNPGDFPGFRRLRAAASSSSLKGSEILWPSGVGIFHRSDSCLLTRLVDSRSPVLCAPFFMSCEAMEFAETGNWWKERPDLPVSLLIVLHALRLECEKSMEFTAFSHRSCFFCPNRNSRDEAALSESVPSGLGWRSDRGSRSLCPSMAHSSSDGHVGYIVWPQIVGSRKNPGMPSQCLTYPEVAISQRIHLWEGKSATNQPCESSNASPDRCGQEPWASVALWRKADVVTAGTFLEHVCPAVGCPGRNSWRPGLGWCRRPIGERSWLFPLGYSLQQPKVVGCCPGVQALTVRRCFVLAPVDMLAVEVTDIQAGVSERRDGRWCESRAWRVVDVHDLVSCDVYTQPLSLWLYWRLIDQWPFLPLMDKRGKAVVPAQDWPRKVGNH